MTCPRCQGLIVNEYDEERCLNCGYRTCFVSPPSAVYRPLPERFKDLPHRRPRLLPNQAPQVVIVQLPPAPVTQSVARKRGRPRVPVEAQLEKKRRYMREYFRRPEMRAKRRAAYHALSNAERARINERMKVWRQRRKAAMQEAAC